MQGHGSKWRSRTCPKEVISHKSIIHSSVVNAILSELQAFFWFELEHKVMGQKGGHVLVRRTSYCISPQYIRKL